MCQYPQYTTRMRCNHLKKHAGRTIACDEAEARGGVICEDAKPNYSFGSSTSQIPCDDCIGAGKYVQASTGRWNKVANSN
ncbi:MAG: hypothetical protein M4579_007514 [Chaenotheca gracillima]|nr:MAG: hypothetical protein M4579_007514 [Chaenotheca gracillima]